MEKMEEHEGRYFKIGCKKMRAYMDSLVKQNRAALLYEGASGCDSHEDYDEEWKYRLEEYPDSTVDLSHHFMSHGELVDRRYDGLTLLVRSPTKDKAKHVISALEKILRSL